jgi:hypothetical protein
MKKSFYLKTFEISFPVSQAKRLTKKLFDIRYKEGFHNRFLKFVIYYVWSYYNYQIGSYYNYHAQKNKLSLVDNPVHRAGLYDKI